MKPELINEQAIWGLHIDEIRGKKNTVNTVQYCSAHTASLMSNCFGDKVLGGKSFPLCPWVYEYLALS